MKKVRCCIGCLGVLAVLLLGMLLSACGQTERIAVTSVDYPELKAMRAGELNLERWERVTYDMPHDPYRDYACTVSVRDGKLFIENRRDYVMTCSVDFGSGSIVGLNRGEFDGWVRYFRDGTNWGEGKDDSKLLIPENCRGLIDVEYEYGWILTGLAHMGTDEGAVYRYWCSDDHKEQFVEKIADLDACPLAHFYDEEGGTLYIVTGGKIYSVNEQNELTCLTPDTVLVEKLYTTSIVYHDGVIFCGGAMGLYRLDPTTGEETFFPMNYEKYVVD